VVPLESVKRKCKFPRITVPSTTDIPELINKVRSTGSLPDKKPAKKNDVLAK
jgi:hypothetical protein